MIFIASFPNNIPARIAPFHEQTQLLRTKRTFASIAQEVCESPATQISIRRVAFTTDSWFEFSMLKDVFSPTNEWNSDLQQTLLPCTLQDVEFSVRSSAPIAFNFSADSWPADANPSEIAFLRSNSWKYAAIRRENTNLLPIGTPSKSLDHTQECIIASFTYRPNSTYSSELFRDLTWARRATRVTNMVIHLTTLNAYISTMGGGYFMCKQVSQAQVMARFQCIVANGMNDPVLAARCRLHLVYLAIQRGKFKRASKALDAEEKNAKQLSSDELEAMIYAARVYLDKVKKWVRSTQQYKAANAKLHTSSSSDSPEVEDSYYRQRIVRSK